LSFLAGDVVVYTREEQLADLSTTAQIHMLCVRTVGGGPVAKVQVRRLLIGFRFGLRVTEVLRVHVEPFSLLHVQQRAVAARDRVVRPTLPSEAQGSNDFTLDSLCGVSDRLMGG
jgi:hypothetical protein